MNILFIAVEAFPFVKVGGLGDVIGSLPKELNKLGADTRVVIPKYSTIDNKLLKNAEFIQDFNVYVGPKANKVELYQVTVDGIIFYLIGNDRYFNRDRIYGFDDDLERWALFQQASLEAIRYMKFDVDIINCHDWHTGMIPQLIKARYYKELGHIKTVFTIHNMMYQGEYDRSVSKYFNLSFDSTMDQDNKVNFMKSAIVASDYVNTVSETYVNELLSSEYFSRGLGFVLKQKAMMGTFSGILNGIDYKHFDPKKDKVLPLKYDFSNYKEGKKEAKEKLYQLIDVKFDKDKPLMGIVSRLTRQKGIDLIKGVFDELLSEYDFKFFILGSGDTDYEDYFRYLESKYPNKVKTYFGYSDELAHLVYGASDMFLMPSAFEPCGLGQMIALKYGSLPIVRETGGLKDSVNPFNEYEMTGNGFSFTNYNAHDMMHVIKYALDTFYQKEKWDMLVKNAMDSDFSFKASAIKYLNLYKRVKGE